MPDEPFSFDFQVRTSHSQWVTKGYCWKLATVSLHFPCIYSLHSSKWTNTKGRGSILIVYKFVLELWFHSLVLVDVYYTGNLWPLRLHNGVCFQTLRWRCNYDHKCQNALVGPWESSLIARWLPSPPHIFFISLSLSLSIVYAPSPVLCMRKYIYTFTEYWNIILVFFVHHLYGPSL